MISHGVEKYYDLKLFIIIMMNSNDSKIFLLMAYVENKNQTSNLKNQNKIYLGEKCILIITSP